MYASMALRNASRDECMSSREAGFFNEVARKRHSRGTRNARASFVMQSLVCITYMASPLEVTSKLEVCTSWLNVY